MRISSSLNMFFNSLDVKMRCVTHIPHATAIVFVLLLGLSLSTNSMAADGRATLSERVLRLESGGGSNQVMVDLVSQLEQMRSEMAELRGMLEQQDFEIQRLKDQQKDQYLDLDSRLTQAAQSGSVQATQQGSYNSTQYYPGAINNGSATNSNQKNIAPPEVAEAISSQVVTQGINVQNTSPTIQMVEADPKMEQRAYEEAFSDLKSGNYAESARKFNAFVDSYPTSDLADNAQYWLGESYYVTRNYKIALDVFQSFIRRYPDSSKLPDTLLKLGFTYFELKDWEQSTRYLQEVVDRYPDTTVARLAKTRLKALKAQP